MNEIEVNKISKSEFIKLNEKNLMFITNPGRMGDEDGSTFIIKHGNEEEYKGKYKYLYMGFGNGLSIDNSIYSEFEPYLNNKVILNHKLLEK